MSIQYLKSGLVLLFFTFYTAVQGQDYSLYCSSYDWLEKPANFVPDSIEKTYPSVTVLMKRINEYRYNDKTRMLEAFFCSHNIKYLNDDKSIEENNKVYIPTYQSQNLVTLKSRVIKNGKVVFEAGQKDFIQVEEEGSKYNMLALKGVEKGCIVETVTIMRLNDYEIYGDEYFQSSSFIKRAEFYLITPEILEFKCKSYNKFSPITDSVANERHVYFGATNNIPPFDAEEKYSLLNANKQRVEYVYHQNAETKKMNAKWPELGRQFYDRMSYEYDKNQKDLEKFLSKIPLDKAKTEAEKVFMIENFLKTNISVDDNLSIEIKTFGDNLKKKVASPFRFNQIMAQLYRKAGINIEYILTCKKEYKRFDPEFDSWSYLRNVLFYIPATKTFIDPQEPFSRMGKISTEYLGQYGLFIKLVGLGDVVSATASVKLVPGNDVKSSNDIEKYTVSLNGALDKAIIQYTRQMYGYAEQNIKSYYFVLDDEKKKEFVETFVRGLAKNATIENLTVENYRPDVFEEINKPLVIQAKLTTDYYVDPISDQSIMLKIGDVIGQQSEMYQEKPRINQVDIDFAHSYTREIIVELPEGYIVKGADKLNINYKYNNSKNEPSYGFVSSYKIEGNKLIIDCVEYYNDMTYKMEEFNQFKQVINAAADFNKITILLEKK